jgi:hypothetical protein
MNLGVFCKFSEQVPEQATTDESACRRRPPLPPPPCVPHEPKRLRLLDPLANPLPPSPRARCSRPKLLRCGCRRHRGGGASGAGWRDTSRSSARRLARGLTAPRRRILAWGGDIWLQVCRPQGDSRSATQRVAFLHRPKLLQFFDRKWCEQLAR